MKIKAKYSLKYQINKKDHELVIVVELKQISDYEPKKNIWQPHILLNGEEYEYLDSEGCVNAYYLTEEIGLFEKKKLKDKYKRKMKITKETIK